MKDDLDNLSLGDLFRIEVENHRTVLSDGLISLERGESSPELLESLMRSAHSIKGAARIVNRTPAVEVAHAMEDCFVAAQKKVITFTSKQMDILLAGVDLLTEISGLEDEELPKWQERNQPRLEKFCGTLGGWLTGAARSERMPESAESGETGVRPPEDDTVESPAAALQPNREQAISRRQLRVTADNLNRLLALAGESKVASKWLDELSKSFYELKHQGRKIRQCVHAIKHSQQNRVAQLSASQIMELEQRTAELNNSVSEKLQQMDLFSRTLLSLSSRLYDEVLDTRMRPFIDGVREFPRMARDLARSLGKEVHIELIGESTPADRDVLEKLEAPLTHLLRNAIDHGIELPDERRRQGKAATGTIRMEARHSSGLLMISVSDDGRGIDPERVRRAVAERKLTTPEHAASMSEAELLEFLFLPGFSLSSKVTELSGRGVGLDVVQTMLKEVGGRVRVQSQSGHGSAFHLELPLTVSVVRTLLVRIAGEDYAFPLSRLTAVRKVAKEDVQSVQGRQYFQWGGEEIGLIHAWQVFELGAHHAASTDLCHVIVLGDHSRRYGLVVDAFLGERDLVVLPLDPRLGKVRNISAAAVMPDRTPVLIIDMDDMLRSVETVVSSGQLTGMKQAANARSKAAAKRILVVDDSLTVRELERKLLEHRGYSVDVAVDGMDGWNAVRSSHYDLVVTDIDMPRMDGIELVSLIKRDSRLSATPVMIVSYKDREEDRQRGLQAGANYYLTKASFHDETLLQAASDLIGEPTE